ncbi:MAG: hypothetical protein B7X84_02175, partial [Alphaproteobacteria bacterium 17-39-52]
MPLLFKRFMASLTLVGYITSFLSPLHAAWAMEPEGPLLTERTKASLPSAPFPTGAHLKPAVAEVPRPSEADLKKLLTAVPRQSISTSLTSSLQKAKQAPWWQKYAFLALTWKNANKKCSQGSLSLLQGYDYATPQGHSYLSAYLLQQFGANRWTCTLSENTLTFGYKPSRDETTLSFAVT